MSLERKHDPQGDKFCENCGEPNPIWGTENDAWNTVSPGGGGILCPSCFIGFFEQLNGGNYRWKVVPQRLPERKPVDASSGKDA